MKTYWYLFRDELGTTHAVMCSDPNVGLSNFSFRGTSRRSTREWVCLLCRRPLSIFRHRLVINRSVFLSSVVAPTWCCVYMAPSAARGSLAHLWQMDCAHLRHGSCTLAKEFLYKAVTVIGLDVYRLCTASGEHHNEIPWRITSIAHLKETKKYIILQIS